MNRVYIAHPLIGNGSAEWGDRRRNLDRYLRFCAYATERGYAVLSWVHHALLHDAGLTNGDHDYYLSRDEALVRAADFLWAPCPRGVSAGVDRELRCAESLRIPVVVPEIEGRQPKGGQWQDSTWFPPGQRRATSAWPLGITEMCREAHRTAVSKGWWGDGAADALAAGEAWEYRREPRSVGEQLALFHSEVSEALEEWRRGVLLDEVTEGADGSPGKPGGFPVELADLLIRVGDTCGRYGIDLEAAVLRKMAYNRTRSYRHGGKIA